MEEQREQAPVVPRYPITSSVKGESVTWYLEDDWLTQLQTTVTNYLNNGRWKSRSHRRFAENVLAIANEISSSPTKDTLINNRLLPLIQAKAGLAKKGWNRKESFLYFFCDFSHRMYFERKRMDQTNQRLETSNAEKILALENSANESKRQLDSLGERFARLNKQLLREQENSEEAQKLSIARIEEQKGEIAALNKETLTLRKELSEKTELTSDLEKRLQIKNDENVLMKQHLREAAQSHYDNKSKQESQGKLESASPGSTKDVEELRAKLIQYEAQNAELKEGFNLALSRIDRLIQRRDKIKASAREAREELGSAARMRNIALNLLDRLFGTTLFEALPSVFLRDSSNKLDFTETQIRLIRRISSAKAPEYPKLEEAVNTTAEAIEEGKPVENLADRFNAGLNGSVRLVTGGIGFLSNQVSKVVPTGSPPREGHSYGPIGK